MESILRTPDERFGNLPDFPYAPHYVDDLPGFEGLRIHYIDEAPAGITSRPGVQKTYLCLHGQPTWSYLFRKMIPVFTAAGHRVVAPDLPGFGRSDKPADDARYTFDFHRDLLKVFVERLDLHQIVLVVQDWGGLLGLTLPPDMPQRFISLLIMNTMFGTGDFPLSQGFLDWRAWSNAHPDMDVGKLMWRTNRHLSPLEIAAYDAPFPDAAFKAGVRRFPQLVPDHPDAGGAALSRRARDWWRTEWTGNTFMAVGMKDPVLGPSVMAEVRRHIRACPAPVEVAEGGHFLQEHGHGIAMAAVRVL